MNKELTTRQKVRSWMKLNYKDHATATQLAEGAIDALNLPNEILDDHTHWIWDEACSFFIAED